VFPLRAAQNLIVENDDIYDSFVTNAGQPSPTVSRFAVMREICRHLAPFKINERPIIGQTVIAKDLTIDSLAVMDMVMELEDHFDISIPMNVMAEIQTVDQLADTVLKLSARH
jgi:acyl carrier protein